MTREALVALGLFALRTFVLSATLFGLYTLTVGLHRALDPEAARDVRDEALRAALFFGGWMTALMVAMSLPEWFRTLATGGPRVRSSERLVVPLARDEAISRCRAALSAEVSARRVRVHGDVLRARARASWSSWGERLAIELTAVDDHRTHVRIASEPLWRGTSLDYGQGRRRVEALRERLERPDAPGAAG